MSLDLSPVGRPAPTTAVIRSQAGLEFRLMMGNGEQLLLTLIIPVVLLVGLGVSDFVSLGADTMSERLDLLVPGIVALAVMSSSFTALAIATGFDRRSEAITFLGTTPLSRLGLLAAKGLAIAAIEAIQIAVITTIGVLLGWRPSAFSLASVAFVLLGTLTFAALGLALAGVLRAEITLAAANAIYLLLLMGGGVIIPRDEFPSGIATVIGLLPSAALADGLRATMSGIEPASIPGAVAVLAVWGIAGSLAVHRWFRWSA